MDELFSREINRVAETHFFLRPMLDHALKRKNQVIIRQGKPMIGEFENCYAYWKSQFGDKFFDMGTMIRLGTAIENCLKYYYMKRKGHASLVELRSDADYNKNAFQRVQNWQSHGAIALYAGIGIDLSTYAKLASIQEAMLHRHLYAHNSGLIDDEYIKNISIVTGQDISTHPDVAGFYPREDVYWFRPLERLSFFIEETRSFFEQFP